MTAVGEFVPEGADNSWATAGTDCAGAVDVAPAGSFLELQLAEANRTNAAPGSHGPILFTES